MKKNQLLETIKVGLELSSKAEAERVLKQMNDIVDLLEVELPVGEKAKLGRIVIEKKHIPARSGKAMGVEWHTEPKDVLKAKIK